MSLMAPSMFFMILTGVFKGYFQGNGSHIPSMHSQILHVVFMFVGGLAGATLYHEYGTKVSALLQNEDYTSVYGAKGAAIGFLSASILCFLHVLILYFIYSRSMKKQIRRELQKNQDTGFRILSMLIGTGAIYALYWLCFNGLPLIDQYLFFLLDEGSKEAVVNWGIYYGKCLVLFGVIGGVINMVCLSPIRRIMGFVERDERQMAREKLGILIHQCAVITIPAAVFLAVLAENILEIMFSGDKQQAAVWVELGSIIIILSVFSAVFMEILIRSRKLKYAAFIGAGAMVLHMLLLLVLLKTAKSGITAVLISNIVFYALVAGAGLFIISRNLQYTQEWIRTFALTAIVSAVSGVLAMLLNKLFAPMLGAVISMIICLLVASISYVVLLVVMRAFRDGELDEMAGGRLLLLLAGALHLS